MKFWFFFVVSIAISLHAFGEIKEIDSVTDLKTYIKKESLILFDIDDTIFTARQELGSDRWFCNYMKRLEDEGKSTKQAKEEALAMWFSLQFKTDTRLMEETSPRLITELQQNKYVVMALTTRSLVVMEPTLHQLSLWNINMKRTAPHPTSFHPSKMPQVMYSEGVLFTNAMHKGQALTAFLDEIHLVPAHVVFINDKHSHLKEVEDELATRNIPFLGLRYTKADESVRNYDPKIADIQLEYLNKILDNDAAKAIALSREKK